MKKQPLLQSSFQQNLKERALDITSSYAGSSSFKTLALLTTNNRIVSRRSDVVEEKSPVLKLYPNPIQGEFKVDLHHTEKINTTAGLRLIE